MSSKDKLTVIQGRFGGGKDMTEEIREKRKAALIEVLDEMRTRAENDQMTELVAASLDDEGEINIHIYALDIPGAIGMFEIGKQILLTDYE